MSCCPVFNRPPNLVDISNIQNCIDDILFTRTQEFDFFNNQIDKMFDTYINNYSMLLSDLEKDTIFLPSDYRKKIAIPFMSFLTDLGEPFFNYIFSLETHSEECFNDLKKFISDTTQALLNPSLFGTVHVSSKAFQALLLDCHTQFMRIVDPRLPFYEKKQIPPLVAWSSPNTTFYISPESLTSTAQMKAEIVSVPRMCIKQGIALWALIGGKIIQEQQNFTSQPFALELKEKIERIIQESFHSTPLTTYWSECADVMISDVYRYLNLGPAFILAINTWCQSLSGSRNHISDQLRIAGLAHLTYLSHNKEFYVLENLLQSNKHTPQDLFFFDTNKDVTIAQNDLFLSAKLTSSVIANEKLDALQGRCLQDVFNWTPKDQEISNFVGTLLRTSHSKPKLEGVRAAHIVSASIIESLTTGADTQTIFSRMTFMLSNL